MGSFEKLGVLVIIVLVVVIVVVAAWGGDSDDRYETLADQADAANLDSGPPNDSGLNDSGPGDSGPNDSGPNDSGPNNSGPPPDPAPAPGPAVDPAPAPDPAVDPALAPAPPVPAGDVVHVVVRGDSLWSIAERHYGNGAHWRRIEKANPGLDPGLLSAGITLKIPKAAEPADRQPAPEKVAKPGTRLYTVRAGDSFWRIAREELGRGSRHSEIAALNPGIDSSRLPRNATIVIPVR